MSVYILYLAYGLVKDYGTAENQMISLAAIILFVAGGGLILANSAYKLIKGDYEDDSIAKDEPGAEGVEDEQPADGAGSAQKAAGSDTVGTDKK